MKLFRRTFTAALVVTAFGLAAAQAAQSAQPEPVMTAGQVRKVDKEAGKITLKHEAIANLDMPAMTMVFGVKDPALLDKVQPGDKVRFHAIDGGGGRLVVTQIEPAK